MPSRALNNTIIRHLKPTPGRQVDYPDSLVPGLNIRVSPKGTKTYVLLYRYQGKSKRLTLGRCDDVSLSSARQAARGAKAQLTQNKDPSLERKRAVRPAQTPFRWLVEQFIEKHAKIKTKSWKETQRILLRDFVKVWGDRDATSIDKHDVSSLINDIAKKYPGAANHAFAHIRKLFNWAVREDYLDRSPCVHMTAPAPSIARERVLSDTEVSAVWNAAASIGYPYGPIVQLLIITAQRRSEVSGMEWQELNFEDRLWTIPSARSKNKKSTILPLSALATQVLDSLPRLHERLVFPSHSGLTSVSGFSKWKSDLDHRSGVQGWVLHDLRRTAATGLASIGTPLDIIERCLNHVSGRQTQVARVYNHFKYVEEQRAALEAWANHVAAITQRHAATSAL